MLNVASLNVNLVYFDWTDACISHPFLDLISLQWEPDETSRAVLLNAYLEGWDGEAEPEVLQEAVELAAVVRPLHHAVSYRTIVAGLEESAQDEHSTDEFLRELLTQMRERARAASCAGPPPSVASSRAMSASGAGFSVAGLPSHQPP